jgi:hypothetical protein
LPYPLTTDAKLPPDFRIAMMLYPPIQAKVQDDHTALPLGETGEHLSYLLRKLPLILLFA